MGSIIEDKKKTMRAFTCNICTQLYDNSDRIPKLFPCCNKPICQSCILNMCLRIPKDTTINCIHCFKNIPKPDPINAFLTFKLLIPSGQISIPEPVQVPTTVSVKTLDDQIYKVKYDPNMNIKAFIEEVGRISGVSSHSFRFMFMGKNLLDDANTTLKDLKINAGHCVQMLNRYIGGW